MERSERIKLCSRTRPTISKIVVDGREGFTECLKVHRNILGCREVLFSHTASFSFSHFASWDIKQKSPTEMLYGCKSHGYVGRFSFRYESIFGNFAVIGWRNVKGWVRNSSECYCYGEEESSKPFSTFMLR